MFSILIVVIAICWQYDDAREYVERARKCLATELAALVSLLYKFFLLILFLGIVIFLVFIVSGIISVKYHSR